MEHPGWRPIRREEFDSLVTEQEAALDGDQKAILDACRVDPWRAVIRRSEQAGDERVWVIAERRGQVLYFDDVEWGWNFSEIDEEGRVLRPGGGQGELRGILGSGGTTSGGGRATLCPPSSHQSSVAPFSRARRTLLNLHKTDLTTGFVPSIPPENRATIGFSQGVDYLFQITKTIKNVPFSPPSARYDRTKDQITLDEVERILI